MCVNHSFWAREEEAGVQVQQKTGFGAQSVFPHKKKFSVFFFFVLQFVSHSVTLRTTNSRALESSYSAVGGQRKKSNTLALASDSAENSVEFFCWKKKLREKMWSKLTPLILFLSLPSTAAAKIGECKSQKMFFLRSFKKWYHYYTIGNMTEVP